MRGWYRDDIGHPTDVSPRDRRVRPESILAHTGIAPFRALAMMAIVQVDYLDARVLAGAEP
jgi:hypothetical protein